LPVNLSVRAGEIRLIYPKLPSKIRAWILEPISEDPNGTRSAVVERRLRVRTKLIEVRIRGLKTHVSFGVYRNGNRACRETILNCLS